MEETLNRHRKILETFCAEKHLYVAEVLEEVVSGESLSSRPKMMRLLELVNTGMYAGVICVDIERLSRGSSLESGYIMQIFQANNCKIITPYKVYDLRNESDEQFTDMKFMFSRYGLKTITKRLVRGRNQSASEGKFMGSVNVPAKNQNTAPWYRCPTRGCKCRAMKCDLVEKSVVTAMEKWLAEYKIKISLDNLPQTDNTEIALSVIQGQLSDLQNQQNKICELLEKGTYTVEMFTKRNDLLQKEMKKLQQSEKDLMNKQSAVREKRSTEEKIFLPLSIFSTAMISRRQRRRMNCGKW